MSALLCFRPKPAARLRLVCFPWAGASAAVLRPLIDALKESDIEVHVVAYAGRGHRAAVGLYGSIDDAVTDVVDDVRALAGPVAIPVALYGHSFGAAVAFAAAARVGVSHVVVGARAAVSVDVSADDLGDDDRLVDVLAGHGVIDRALFDDAEARALLLPPLLRDLRLSARHTSDLVIDVPITALRGRDDTTVSAAQLAAWRAHTRAAFASHVVDGGHLFVRDAAPATALLLRRVLSP